MSDKLQVEVEYVLTPLGRRSMGILHGVRQLREVVY